MKTKCPKCGHLFAPTEMASKGGRTSAARLTPLERRARARAAASHCSVSEYIRRVIEEALDSGVVWEPVKPVRKTTTLYPTPAAQDLALNDAQPPPNKTP